MTLIKDRALERVAHIDADWNQFIEELPDHGDATNHVSELDKRTFYGRYHYKREELNPKQLHICETVCRLVGARSWTVNKINPGAITVPHRDRFTPAAKAFGEWEAYQRGDFDPRERYIRYWIPINDRSLGQWFEAEGVRTLCDWRAGDVIVSPSTHVHCSATVGTEPRYIILADGMQSETVLLQEKFTQLRIE